MEKILKKVLGIIFGLFCFSSLFCQTQQIDQKIRFNVWSELDAYPEFASEDLKNGQYDYPISQIKKTTPFLISGMVYGWKFKYVPSDKARNVEEIFEIEEIKPFDYRVDKLNFSEPKVDNNRLSYWCEFVRSDYQRQYYLSWNSIKNPVISGRGYGRLDKGFEGYVDASKDALKQAVREYYRPIIKEKPKEISGTVLIKNIPVSGIFKGQYAITLDFFMESDRIIKYTSY